MKRPESSEAVLPGRVEVMTLMFTDLVGSTRLKDRMGNAEGLRLIHAHHALLRSVLGEYPGATEISTAGDSFFIAFSRPSDAVVFALRLQARLREWGRTQPVRLEDRIGIHAGEVEVVRNAEGGLRDLHGLEVDKCARVMALAGGGRIFLTRFAFDNARSSLRGLPLPGVGRLEWLDHGRMPVKGVTEPIEIFEVAETGQSRPGPRILPLVLLSAGIAVLGARLPPVRDASYDLAFLTRRVEPPSDAVLVYMDEKSEEEFGLGGGVDRWDRTLHARLMDRLREAGARVGVWDVVFNVPDPARPEADQALVEAARRWGKVVVAGMAVTRIEAGLRVSQDEGPFRDLAGVSVWGVVPKGDPDIPVRHLFPGSVEVDGLPVLAARLAGGRPTDRWRRAWVNYYGPAGTLRSFRFAEVLSGRVASGELTNKVVFVGRDVRGIGYTRGWASDTYRMPFIPPGGGRIAGVELVATATCNLLRGEALFRLDGFAEAGLLAALGAVGGVGIAGLPGRRALAWAFGWAVVVAAVSALQVWQTHQWWAWLAVSAIAMPLTLVCRFASRRGWGTRMLRGVESDPRDPGVDRTRSPAGRNPGDPTAAAGEGERGAPR